MKGKKTRNPREHKPCHKERPETATRWVPALLRFVPDNILVEAASHPSKEGKPKQTE